MNKDVKGVWPSESCNSLKRQLGDMERLISKSSPKDRQLISEITTDECSSLLIEVCKSERCGETLPHHWNSFGNFIVVFLNPSYCIDYYHQVRLCATYCCLPDYQTLPAKYSSRSECDPVEIHRSNMPPAAIRFAKR